MSAVKQPHSMVGGATLFSRAEAARFCRQIIESETYRETIADRIKTKTLPAAIEQLLWYYAYGKPVEQIQMQITGEDLSELPLSELQARARKIAEELAEAEALAEAIDMSPNVTKGPWQP